MDAIPSPAEVARIHVTRRTVSEYRARKANCHKLGYHGPLTRAELAARITT